MTPTEKKLKQMGISLEEFGDILVDDDVISDDYEEIIDDWEDEE